MMNSSLTKMGTALFSAALLLASCGGNDSANDSRTPLAPAATEEESLAPASAAVDDIDTPPQTQPTDGGSLPGNVGEDLPPPSEVLVDLPSPEGVNASLGGTFLDLDEFPYSAILSGGPPKDGIPALTNPSFVAASEVSYLSEDDMVLGVVINGEARAYPHNIGWWHEIVNDKIGGHPISVTFCPLTGTGLVFDALDENGQQFELGVSGLLFNTNLIMYDRRDRATLYPQIAHKAVEGPRKGETLKLMPVVETTWSTWKRLHPDTRVIAQGTYVLSQYKEYPYGDYRTNNNFFLFALTTALNDNLNPYSTFFGSKERVLGIRLDGEAKAYPLSSMGEQQIINDQVGGVDIVVVWDREYYLASPYAREVEGQILSFDIESDSGIPFSLRDRETGTLWDINGLGVDGPLAGKKLTQVPAHNSMWFAWVTFWQNTDVWQ